MELGALFTTKAEGVVEASSTIVLFKDPLLIKFDAGLFPTGKLPAVMEGGCASHGRTFMSPVGQLPELSGRAAYPSVAVVGLVSGFAV